MALRDQPYLPLYIQDFLTDEKLAQCTAESNGVYIRVMCLMHKSEQYGKIILKEKNKHSTNNLDNFASMLTKQMPYEFHTVKKSLAELVDEKVLLVEGDMLVQKRMVKDNEISEARSKAGQKGGKISFAQAKAQAKVKANNEYENEDEVLLGKEGTGEKPFYTPSLIPEPTGEKFPIEDCLAIALRDDRWVKANKTNEAELNEFNAMLERIATYHEVPIEYKRYFGHWKAKGKLDLVKPAATPAYGQSGALQRIKEKYS